MRIAVSLLNFRPGRIGGTETYLRELVAHLPRVAEDDEVVLLVDRHVARQFENCGLELFVANQGPRNLEVVRFLEATTPYRARSVERLVESAAPDVALFPQQAIFPKNVDCPVVLVVHDRYHQLFPEALSPIQLHYRRGIYGWSLSRADAIVTVSDYTRRCLVRDEGFPGDTPIHTIHHGMHASVNGPSAASPATGLPYVYYPAATHPHKNHLELFESIARLRALGEFPHQLILSGQRTAHWGRLRRRVRQLGLQDVVRHLGFVPFETVQGLYRGSEAVVFPSRYEGFGLPIVEAVAFGKRVISSDIESFREIGVPDRFRIDFSSPGQLLAALHEPGPTILTRTLPVWEETARRTLDVARSACGATAVVEPSLPRPRSLVA